MLDSIIRFSLHNRLVVLVGAVLLILGGFYAAQRMEVDVFPDLNAPTVVVMTEAKGMAPEEVERLVTFPIETAVNGATDVRRVRSSSTTGFSIVWVEFEWGTDIYRARQIVSEKLAMSRDLLPPNVGNPTLGPQSSILGELMFVGMSSDGGTSLQELRTLADWIIRPRILATGGVAQVSVIGGDIREYQILLDVAKMRHYQIGLNEVYRAVQGMNENAAGGILYEYGNEYIVRGLVATNHAEQLSQAVVKHDGTSHVLLGDIAEVEVGNKAPRTGLASMRNKPAVLLTITKQPATSTLELTKQIDAALHEIKQALPGDVTLSTDIYRQERFIRSAIDNVQRSLYEGAIFVVIVLFLFLMNVRTTIISLVTIPLALIVSLLVLRLSGLTINTMSLGGMAIAIGSLVDDAIVDVENVFKHLRENSLRVPEERLPIRKVIFDASREVRMPILNSTLIIVASFVPLFFLSGMEGRMLAPLGITFITALSASTLVALTLTPVLCSYLLGRSKKNKPQKESAIAGYLKKVYHRSLLSALKHERTVLWATGGVFVIALALFFTLGRSFLPPFNEGSMTINVSSLPGISLEESDKIGNRVEQILLEIPEVQTVGRKTGRAELDEHALGVSVSEIEAPFVLGERSKDELLAEVREKLSLIPGTAIEVGAPITHRIDAMLSGTRASIAIKLFGTDLNKMFILGNQIQQTIAPIKGLVDLNVEQQVERPQLQIIPRRAMLAKYGMSLPEFKEVVNILLAGEAVSQVYEGDKVFDLVLKAQDETRSSAERIGDMTVDVAGQQVPLSMLAEIKSSMGPNTINRENVARKIVISANVAGRDLRSVVSDIEEAIEEKISLPEGYRIEYGGQFESEQAASRTLLITSLFAILVIFILLFRQFRSAKESLVILLNLPLALIGGVLTLWLTGADLSIPAIIGFISLFGIATRNGMLLVTRYHDLQAEGLSVQDSIVIGSTDRLNPILMTALTSALALVPLAFGSSLPGNEIQSPMAQVILGGLFTSTLLNGYILPIIMMRLHSKTSPNPQTPL